MSKHYDVAVLGAGIGALTTAALLARRSWRVLVLGQGWRPSSYTYDGIDLARRAFTLSCRLVPRLDAGDGRTRAVADVRQALDAPRSDVSGPRAEAAARRSPDVTLLVGRLSAPIPR